MTQVQKRLQTEVLLKMFGFCFGTFLKFYIFDVVALHTGFGTRAGPRDSCSCSPEQTGNCHLEEMEETAFPFADGKDQ